jgi:hypothetical protein
MKKLTIFLLCLSMLMFACTIASTVTPPTQTPVVIQVPVTVTSPPATEAPTEVPPTVEVVTPSPAANVTCNEVSLYLAPELASGYDCKTVPETSGEAYFDKNPQYTEITLQGYPLADRFFSPRIQIYPVQRYSELAPDAVNPAVADLQALLAGGPTSDHLPLLPIFNAAQVFRAQYSIVPFANGSGIRFLTEYAQYAAPVNNHDMFYAFQGLTSDGQYWISAILPMSHPILPANADTMPNGQSFEDFANNYVPYITDMTNQLNSQGADSFIPTLTALDMLVASIHIAP